jgi:hypothetical protein
MRSKSSLTRVVTLALAAGPLAACLPSIDFASPPDGGPEGGTDASMNDAGLDAADATQHADGDDGAPSSDAEAGVQLVTSVGLAQMSTGDSQQVHLVFAKGAARWWLFYVDDDASTLKTTSSPDLVTWTPSASLTLPQSNSADGRGFSVAYAQLGGADVVHVALSLHDASGRNTYDARAKLTGTTITWDPLPDAMTSVLDGGDPSCDPDGPAIAITADGHVIHTTGWYETCNDFVLISDDVDTGQSWSSTFTEQYVGFVPITSHNRQIIALQGTDAVLTYDDGEYSAAPDNLQFAEPMAGSWPGGPTGTVFPEAGVMTFADWATCGRTVLEIDSVRRASADGGVGYGQFEHAKFTPGSGTWTPGDPIADDVGQPGSGVVMLTNGTSMLLFAIAFDYSIRATRWTTAGWSAWSTVVPAPTTTTRAYLTGTGCPMKDHAAVMWTEGDTSFSIMALDVAGMF